MVLGATIILYRGPEKSTKVTIDVPAALSLKELEVCWISFRDGGPACLTRLFRDAAVSSHFGRVGAVMRSEGMSDFDLPVAVLEKVVRWYSHGRREPA